METGTTGTVCTFLYPVTDTSGASVNLTAIDLNGTGANDNAMTVSQSGDLWAGGTLPGVSLVTPDRTKTFTSYNLAVQLDENNKPQLVVTGA